MKKILTVLALTLLIAACGGKEKETEWGVYNEPIESTVLPTPVGVKELSVVWEQDVGGSGRVERNPGSNDDQVVRPGQVQFTRGPCRIHHRHLEAIHLLGDGIAVHAPGQAQLARSPDKGSQGKDRLPRTLGGHERCSGAGMGETADRLDIAAGLRKFARR